ncbi:DUF3499 domain-containing protein [Tsukamurella soli]|uniref:DUF3499 domain-containing protein n=1 Tax=Tsukamurella soli TaxID=644556 RepID=A0ABP8K3M8_9ACTN
MATLTFDYGESIAVLGPLATSSEPHSWDLCEFHANRTTAPRGWEMLRNIPAVSAPAVGANALDDDLTALADTVRERERPAATSSGGLPRIRPVGRDRRASFSDSDPAAVSNPVSASPSASGRHTDPLPAANPFGTGRVAPPADRPATPTRQGPKHAAPTRRGHLRVLPDPVD